MSEPLNKEPAQPSKPGVRLLVTDELGIVKGVEAQSAKSWERFKVATRWGEPDRQRGIGTMCISSRGGLTDTESAVMVVGRGAAGYEVLQPLTGKLLGKVGKALSQSKPDNVTGVAVVRAGGSLDYSVLSSTASGMLRLHSPPTAEPSTAWEELSSWSAGQACECLALHSGGDLAAVGGQGSEVAVWSLETQKKAFGAKGAKKDFLGLQDKPWVTALAWLPGEDTRKVVVGTGSSKVRLYDLSTTMRRPVMEASFEVQTRVTAVAPAPDGAGVWAANGLGVVQQWDLAANRMMGVLKGHGGAIRSLAVHPEEPLIASVGLDRFLRVHNCNTRKQVCRLYIKQQLTGVAWCPLEPQASEAEDNSQPTAGAPAKRSNTHGKEAIRKSRKTR
mmetsp:Transcript_24417/g.67866  ORF Transcript_24417/g.67866 Transcript_24417/m.67866 type:complete len:389 (-) Transcript_24417:35-1201(-)